MVVVVVVMVMLVVLEVVVVVVVLVLVVEVVKIVVVVVVVAAAQIRPLKSSAYSTYHLQQHSQTLRFGPQCIRLFPVIITTNIEFFHKKELILLRLVIALHTAWFNNKHSTFWLHSALTWFV